MFLDLTTFQVLAIFAAYTFAATAKGVTGLGFSTTCLPILALIFGLKDAFALVIIPSVCSNLVVMRQAGRFRETILRFWPMLVTLLPGLAFGLLILSQIDSAPAGAVLGTMLLLWSAFSFFNPNLRLPVRWERPVAPVSGFVTGMVNGVTGSQVMPVVPFLMSLHLDRSLFVQAVNCSFTLSSFVLIIGLSQLGMFSTNDLLISAIGTSFVFLGLRLGSSIRDHLSETAFRTAILGMISAMGVSLVLPVLL